MMRFGTEIDFSISGLTFGAQSVHQFAPNLEFVEDGGLTSLVQPYHQNPHLLPTCDFVTEFERLGHVILENVLDIAHSPRWVLAHDVELSEVNLLQVLFLYVCVRVYSSCVCVCVCPYCQKETFIKPYSTRYLT
jgi:hypothetical protein